ncbi:MAG: sigma-70 family RNA polymerase sigma factor [Myxococcota bacterium]
MAADELLFDDETVETAMEILDVVARSMARRFGSQIQREDLLSIGHLALMDLLRRFDPERSPLEPYLHARLKWAILDGLRSQTHGRYVKARAAAIRASLELTEARAQTDSGSPRSSGPVSEGTHALVLRETLRDHALAMGIKLVQVPSGGDTAVTNSSQNPERLTDRRVLLDAVRQAVSELEDARQRTLVERHYFGGEPLTTIGADLGLSKSWASRLHADAVRRLEKRVRTIIGGSVSSVL